MNMQVRYYPAASLPPARGWQTAFFSISFASLIFLIPWEMLAGSGFEDRQVYIDKLLHQPMVMEEKGVASLREFFFNEALWDLLIRWSSDALGLSPNALFNVITFACLVAFSAYLMNRQGPAALLLLLNPLVIDFAFSQLRMALALTLVLLASLTSRRVWLYLAVVVAAFLHTAIVLFVVMYLSSVVTGRWFRKRRFPVLFLGLAAIAGGAVVALLAGPLRANLLTSVEDRRAEYELVAASLSYASYWILLLAVMPLQKARFYRDDVNLFAVACLSSFVSTTLLGVFGTRFLSAAYPMLMAATLDLARPLREIMLLCYVLYSALQWFYWLQ